MGKIFLRKTSLVDYPGRVSAVFFLQGCNLRCPWCHNRELVAGGASGLVSLDAALAHLQKRQNVLRGVVLSGGEPCLQNELPGIIREIKKLNLTVKLDTNGMFPAMLEKLFITEETCPDYIALDLKIAPARYRELIIRDQKTALNHPSILKNKTNSSGSPTPGEELIQSAALIRESGIEHEYRTLALPDNFITEKDIEELALLPDNAPWYFRPFKGGNCLDPAWNDREEPVRESRRKLKALAAKARELGKNGMVD